MGRWNPVNSLFIQTSHNLGDKEPYRKWINFKVEGRVVTLQDENVTLAGLLPEGYRVCKMEDGEEL